jgi:alpha/beta superfamily hydrolase
MVRGIESCSPERLFLEGPAGKLHATYECPVAEPQAAVLHLHPHPLRGGTRQNNVVRYGALGALEAGCAALRIDFRGVGLSEGNYDEGEGEVFDAAAAFEWLALRHPGIPVFVWGFSFGSRVGLDFCIHCQLQADEVLLSSNPGLALSLQPAGYMAVAWPTRFYAWPRSRTWPENLAFIAGADDNFVHMTGMNRVRQQGGEVKIVDEATHFFPGKLDVVQNWTKETLEKWL